MTKKIVFSMIIIFLLISSCKNNKNENNNMKPLIIDLSINTEKNELNHENFLVSNNDTLPLIVDLNMNDEINMNGQIILFNGWYPNIRMITENNKIIGIYENSISIEIINNMIKNDIIITGVFKLKYLYETDIPYYENPLMICEIIEYKNVKLINDKNN
jgi:hypothetical protein